MELLIQALAEVTDKCPQDPFVPEWICIQSRGMKQWISLELAKIRGISARLNFLFPGDLIQHFLEQQHPDRRVLDMDALVWAVYARLDDYPPGPHLAPLASYYETDATGRKQMQLARQIAGVLDDYQVYRPDMLLNWEKSGPQQHPENPTEIWQSWLWRKIVSTSRTTSLPLVMKDLVAAAAKIHCQTCPAGSVCSGCRLCHPCFCPCFQHWTQRCFYFF